VSYPADVVTHCPNCGAPRTDATVCGFCNVIFESGARATSTTSGYSPAVVAALRAGNKIEAIKLHREATNLGLRESKDAVDLLEKKLGL